MTMDADQMAELRSLAAEAEDDDYIHVKAPNLLALLDALEAAQKERDVNSECADLHLAERDALRVELEGERLKNLPLVQGLTHPTTEPGG